MGRLSYEVTGSMQTAKRASGTCVIRFWVLRYPGIRIPVTGISGAQVWTCAVRMGLRMCGRGRKTRGHRRQGLHLTPYSLFPCALFAHRLFGMCLRYMPMSGRGRKAQGRYAHAQPYPLRTCATVTVTHMRNRNRYAHARNGYPHRKAHGLDGRAGEKRAAAFGEK